MIKKEVYVVENIGDNQSVLYGWISKNKGLLNYVSEEQGCVCCVSIFEIEGKEEILETFPKEIIE